jgi:hypothetical protein
MSSTTPDTCKHSVSIIAFSAKALPVSRWHHVQWQQWVKRGRWVSL